MIARSCSIAVAMAVMGLAGCQASSSESVLAHDTSERPLEVPPASSVADETPDWWYLSGAAMAQSRGAGERPARNVIVFIGDGMGVATVSAARIFAGQQQGRPGEEHLLAFEQFGHTAMVKTYNTDQQTPDSAGTMTAMMSGVKTRAGMIGVDNVAVRRDCASARDTEVETLLGIAQDAGMGTGIVTTTRITHATPAATFAHAPERNWESDAQMRPEALAEGCVDIARQLVEGRIGSRLDVIMGGGRNMLTPNTQADPEHPSMRGMRRDGRDLIAEWQQRHPDGVWMWNQEQFEATDFSTVPRVLALFEHDHMKFEHDRPRDRAGEPSLAEMTRAAIQRLQGEAGGYVLMVEGGRIDHAHHFGNAFRALSDTVAFSDAVQVAKEMTDESDTLILVTADHSHVLSFGGYPRRGNPILGVVRESFPDGSPRAVTDATGRAFTTLSYANGPGYAGASDTQPEGPKTLYHHWTEIRPATRGRPNLRNVDVEDPDYLQEAMVPLASETHGGEDVPLYARGPGAQAVRGVLEQHVLFHIAVQATPALRNQLCEPGACRDGVPAALVRPQSPNQPRGDAQAR